MLVTRDGVEDVERAESDEDTRGSVEDAQSVEDKRTSVGDTRGYRRENSISVRV